MIRSQIPKFRLPESVIDEEVGYVTDLGMELRLGERIHSLKALIDEGYDAIFVGSGAPRGRDLDIPGRKEAAANIHIGIDWLSSVSFGHVTHIGKRVIVLGGGNTAMDCCRSSKRLGGENVTVVVRSGYEEMKASPWEKEDATHEGIPIMNFLVPKAFLHTGGKLTGMRFEKVAAKYDEKGRRNLVPTGEPDVEIPCDDVLVAVGQENSFPWIERDIGLEFDRWGLPKLDPKTMQSSIKNVFFGGDSAFGPKNIIWAVAHGHEAAISIHQLCSGATLTERPPPMVNLSSQKMGIHEWSYDNDIAPDKRYRVPLRELNVALKDIKLEVELGYDEQLAFKEAERCFNCDVQTVFSTPLCIECDACVDICPMDCISFTDNEDEDTLRNGLHVPAVNLGQDLYVSTDAQDRARDGEGRGCLPALRAVRRALSDRRLGYAEILSGDRAGGIGMPNAITGINDFVVKFANVNGSGSASANLLFAKSITRMGVPVATRNIFPSNIQGLPTWYEVRVSGKGYRGRRGGVDLMVPMNPQTWDHDIAEIEPGGYVFYDSTRPIPQSKFRPDINVIGMPLTEIVNAAYTDSRQRQLFKNIIYVGALSALLDIDPKAVEERIAEQFKGKDKLIKPNFDALHMGRDYALTHLKCPLGIRVERADAVGDKIFIDGNNAAALGAVYGGATFAAWYPITPSSSLAEAFPAPLPALSRRQGDRQTPFRHRAGRGRTRLDRHGDRRGVERIARLHDDLRPRHFADAGISRARLFRRDSGGAVRRAARRAVDRHADADAAGRSALLRLCQPRRHQARHAVPAGPEGSVRDGRAGFRSRRPFADADLRHARSRYRHE